MIEITKADTVAQEKMAQDEQNIGVFFAAFAIQYLLHKDMLQNILAAPKFLKHFGDITLSASQRIFIKEIIRTKDSDGARIVDELQGTILESMSAKAKYPRPDLFFLSRIQKDFLIKQIFAHSPQETLPKYAFIDKFVTSNIREVDLKKLINTMWVLSVEQQILILCRIFVALGNDGNEKNRKTIIDSFSENLDKWKQAMSKPPYDILLTTPNIITMTAFISQYNATED